MNAPCYLCGKDAVLDGLCAECYNREHPLIRVSSPLEIIACKRCGSVKIPGGWRTIPLSSSESDELMLRQIDNLLSREVERLTDDVEITYNVENRLDRVLYIRVKAAGRSHTSLEPHTEEYPVEVRLSYVTCDTCGMMSGGYHEAILQIRADGREVTDVEEEEILSIVTQIAEKEYGKDAKAFATESKRTKIGFDFKMGSDHMARLVADELQSRYLADRKENYKLIGQEHGGKGKYRVTILIRLPRWVAGDFVRVAGRPCQVISINRNGMTCQDLTDGQKSTINPKSSKWRTLEFLASQSVKREYMVLSRGYGQSVQLMDAKTFTTVDVVETPLSSEWRSGSRVFLVEIDGVLYPLPESAALESDAV